MLDHQPGQWLAETGIEARSRARRRSSWAWASVGSGFWMVLQSASSFFSLLGISLYGLGTCAAGGLVTSSSASWAQFQQASSWSSRRLCAKPESADRQSVLHSYKILPAEKCRYHTARGFKLTFLGLVNIAMWKSVNQALLFVSIAWGAMPIQLELLGPAASTELLASAPLSRKAAR